MALPKNLRIKKSREALDFSSLAKLLAGQGADEFVTSEMLIPYMTEKLTEYQNNLIAGAPAALDNLNEIAQKLGALSASDSSFENSLATIIGTMATITGVDAKLALKADLSFVESSNAQINGQISTEAQTRQSEDARIASEANSYAHNEALSAKDDANAYTANQILNLNQNVLPLLASKTLVSQSIADSVTAERIVAYNNQETNNTTLIQLIETKVTPAEATAISTVLVSALRAEMLAIEGIDSARFDALNALLAQLTALEAGDVTGIMTALSGKVDKTSVLGYDWIHSTLSDWSEFRNLTDVQMGEGKLVDIRVLRHLVNDLYFHSNTKVSGTKIAKESWIDPSQTYSIETFLSEAMLNGDHVFSAELTQAIIKVLNAKVNTKVEGIKIVKSAWINPDEQPPLSIDYWSDYELNDDYVFSAKLTQALVKMINDKANGKVDKAKVLTHTQTGTDWNNVSNVADDDVVSANSTYRFLIEMDELKADKTTVQTMQATITTQAQTIETQQAEYASLLQRVMDLEDAMSV